MAQQTCFLPNRIYGPGSCAFCAPQPPVAGHSTVQLSSTVPARHLLGCCFHPHSLKFICIPPAAVTSSQSVCVYSDSASCHDRKLSFSFDTMRLPCMLAVILLWSVLAVLVQACIQPEPARRPTCSQLLQLPYLQDAARNMPQAILAAQVCPAPTHLPCPTHLPSENKVPCLSLHCALLLM